MLVLGFFFFGGFIVLEISRGVFVFRVVIVRREGVWVGVGFGLGFRGMLWDIEYDFLFVEFR